MSGQATAASQRRRGPLRGQQGAVAVEFALVLPVLAMLLLGIVTAGLSYSHAIGLSNAVREGARFGATRDVADGNAAWAAAVNARTREVQFDDPSGETTVCVRLDKNNAAEGSPAAIPTAGTQRCYPTAGAPIAGPAPSAPAVEGQKCVVLVWAARPFQINALLASWDRNMVRKSVARYERTC